MTISKELNVKLVPYEQPEGLLPKKAQWFFANKLYNTFLEGEVVWTLGEYVWGGAVNDEMTDEDEIEIINAINAGRALEYDLVSTLDRNDQFKIDTARNQKTGAEINRQDVLKGTPHEKFASELDETIYTYFATNFITEAFLADELEAQQAIDLLKPLGKDAMLESQKLLYVGLQKKPELNIEKNSDILPLLKDFTDNGFPKICAMYNCKVYSTKDNSVEFSAVNMGPSAVGEWKECSVDLFFAGTPKNGFVFDYTMYESDGKIACTSIALTKNAFLAG